jgi:hypothetical protein
MAVRWVKCLAPFQTLSLKDQVLECIIYECIEIYANNF